MTYVPWKRVCRTDFHFRGRSFPLTSQETLHQPYHWEFLKLQFPVYTLMARSVSRRTDLQKQSYKEYKGLTLFVINLIILTCLWYLAIFLEPQSFLNPFRPPQSAVLSPTSIVAFASTLSPTPTLPTDTPTATHTILPSPTTNLVSPVATPTVSTPTVVPRATLSNLAQRPAGAPTSGKWIDVDIGDQTIAAYNGRTLLKKAIVSTGVPSHPTVIGRFAIYQKVMSQIMTGGNRFSGDYYFLPGVPNVMYFYRGYAIHGTYWHHNFGTPMSHGCVNLTIDDAKWFYDWAEIGTPVITHP